MRRNRIFHQFLSSLIALVMIFSLLLPGSVFAANRQPDSEKAIENGEKTLLTGIIITGLEAPEIGKPLVEHADVKSVEGVRWEIPVFWMDEDGNELSGTAETEECFPILAFVLPPEYTMAEDDVIAISDEVLTLFRGKTFYTVYDAETGIIYILISLVRPGLLVMDMGQAEPQEMIPLPENILIPGDGEETAPTIESGSEKEQGPGEEPEREQGSEKESGTDENPERAETVEPERVPGDGEETGPTKESGSDKEQEPGEEPEREQGSEKESGTDENSKWVETVEPEPEEEAEPLRVDLVPVHCAKTAQESLSQEDLARLVDLVRNKIQPQTVNYLIDRIPAFREAFDQDGIGKNIGFYVYSGSADPGDKTRGHEASPTANAYISGGNSYDPETKEYIYSYVMGLNAGMFFEKDENGIYKMDPETGLHILITDDKKLQDLENTIVHEMLHVLMHDYNRVGMSGFVKEDMWWDPSYSNEEKWQMYRETRFPTWFMEGLATSVQNAYQDYFLNFSFFSYDGDGELEEDYTPETVRNAYNTTFFKTNPDSMLGYNMVFDLEAGEDPSVKMNKVGAQYVSGYLAILYLSELTANQNGETSLGVDENGRAVLDSEPLRIGISTILSRLHNGETLDELIADISDGEFKNTADFQTRFIKGDDDSLDFCVDYLNYMRDLTNQPDRQYLPNGSVMLDFDLDYMSPFDRNVDGVKNTMIIVDSDKMERSTVDNVIAYVGGGTVTKGNYTELDDENMDVDESGSLIEEPADDDADPDFDDTDGESEQDDFDDASWDESGSDDSLWDDDSPDDSSWDDTGSGENVSNDVGWDNTSWDNASWDDDSSWE